MSEKERTEFKTIGSHTIKNFKRLDPREIRYGNLEQLYEGNIINDYTKKEQRCTWDELGRVVNRNLPKYDIDPLDAELFLTH